jgi:osmoprotectant transport system substrate-binding protein
MIRNAVIRASVFLLIILMVSITFSQAHACVGRKLVLGALEDDRQGMVSRILTILIHERTGTTVELKYFPDMDELMSMVHKGKVDLFVDYVDLALARLKEDTSNLTREEGYSTVKRRYDEEFNLVWLKPMGFSGQDPRGSSQGWAAVVVKKDTLKKFPALPRLLEKIGTRVPLSDDVLEELVAKGRKAKPAKVAREFLKEEKLI